MSEHITVLDEKEVKDLASPHADETGRNTGIAQSEAWAPIASVVHCLNRNSSYPKLSPSSPAEKVHQFSSSLLSSQKP